MRKLKWCSLNTVAKSRKVREDRNHSRILSCVNVTGGYYAFCEVELIDDNDANEDVIAE